MSQRSPTSRRDSVGAVTCSPPEPAAVPQHGRFPYLVVRLMAAIYQREEIDIQVGEPAARIGYRSSFVRHPAPYTADGGLSPGCRDLLVRAVLAAVENGRFRMCLVWARDACTFCEKDGVARDSNQPPSGGFGSGGVDGTPLPMDIRYHEQRTLTDDDPEQ